MNFISNSSCDTQKIGQKLVKELGNCRIIFLSGILGAGKTELIRGIAKGLGVKTKITSPTFNIFRVYDAPSGGKLYHFDCYRLKKYADLVELGWEEILADKNAIIVLEWPECIIDGNVKNFSNNTISINIQIKNDDRIINVKDQMPKVKDKSKV